MLALIFSCLLASTVSYNIPLGLDLRSAQTAYKVSRDLWSLSNWAFYDPVLDMVEEEREKLEDKTEAEEEGWAWMNSVNINEWIPVLSTDATEDVFVSSKVGESEQTWSDYLLSKDWFERYTAALEVLGERNEPVCQEKTFTCPDSMCAKVIHSVT